MTEPRRRSFKRQTHSLLKGLLFASPWLLGLLVFYAYPIGASLYYSFTSFSVLQPARLVDTANYIRLFTNDKVFALSVTNSLIYAAMMLPSSIVVGICMALLLNAQIRGMRFYRALYYMPVLVPPVAAAVIWMWVLNPQVGILNAILGFLGLPQPGWLSNAAWAKPSLVLIGLWGIGNAVVIYLAGLQDVPRELLEAAEIDGANKLQQIWAVSLPMITPVIFFNLIMGVIGAFQHFALPYTLTSGEGGPAQSLLFYSMYLYRMGFTYLRMGIASAMAWLLLVAVLVATLIVFGTSSRWVYYGGVEERG